MIRRRRYVYEMIDWTYVKIEYKPEYAYYHGLFEAKRIDKTHWKQKGESKPISNLTVLSKINFAEEMQEMANGYNLSKPVTIIIK